jgi:hypothetical protein
MTLGNAANAELRLIVLVPRLRDWIEPARALVGLPEWVRREPLQAHPKELPHPRRQVEGGHVASHFEQLQAEKRYD